MAKKIENYQNLKKTELITMVDKTKKDLREMRFDRVLGSTFNIVDFKKAKKKLAKVLTALKQNELEESQRGSK